MPTTKKKARRKPDWRYVPRVCPTCKDDKWDDWNSWLERHWPCGFAVRFGTDRRTAWQIAECGEGKKDENTTEA